MPQTEANLESLKGQKALVVDDEEELREIIAMILTREGVLVETAENGEEALKLWRNNPYDLVITDLNMPVLNGAQMISRMREIKTSATKFFILTGGVKNDWQIVDGKDITLHVTETIAKPFTRKSLIEKISRKTNV